MNQKTLESKQEIINKITESFKDAGSLTIVEYRGLTVAQLSELRKLLKAQGSTFNVYKNTLVARATTALGHEDLTQYLSGSNAFVFSKEISDGPKVLTKFARRNDALVIKAGLVEGKVYDAEGMKAISKLPGREGLISMFLSCLQAPIRSFACSVKAVADSKN